MTLFDDLLAEAQALALPTSPGGQPFPTAASPGKALWLAIVAHAKTIDDVKTLVGVLQQAIANGSGIPTKTVFAASGTWTKPAGAKLVQVITFGGGGAGGIGRTTGGGAGGERAERWYMASDLPATVPVVVGAGGAGQTIPNGGNVEANGDYAGGPGGTSSFGATSDAHYLVAGGGAGGGWTSDPYALGGAGGRTGFRMVSSPNPHWSVSEYPWRLAGAHINGSQLFGLVMFPVPGAGAPSCSNDYRLWGGTSFAPGSSGSVQGLLQGQGAPLGGPAGGGAGNVYEGSTSLYRGRAGGESGTAERGTGAAGTSDTTSSAGTLAGVAGTSRTGTGRAGSGGGGLYTETCTSGRTRSGGAGGIPAAGGGAVAVPNNVPGGAMNGGAGGRGEVIVTVTF